MCVSMYSWNYLPLLNTTFYIPRSTGNHHESMVFGFTTTCVITKVVNLNPAHGEVSSIQHCVIKFVSDLRQVGCFLRVLRFSPPIKLTASI